MDKFIIEFDNHLEPELCKEIIERFDKDDMQVEGSTKFAYMPFMKQTTDVYLSLHPKWKDIDDILYEKLGSAIQDYVNQLYAKRIRITEWLINTKDSGFNIQRYTKGKGFYDWHNDYYTVHPSIRMLTYLWYLNDIEEGGETEFIDGTKIKPKAGKLVIFPSCWTFIHRGHMPISSDKYIVTGWLSSTIPMCSSEIRV